MTEDASEAPLGPAGFQDDRTGNTSVVTVALGVVLSVVALISAGVVIATFVWAARKDGEEDRALQRRLGIRRRTRIGR